MDGDSSVGKGIKRYRLKHHWSLKRLSQECGIPISTLSKVENGQMSLKIEKLMSVCAALDIDVMQLVSPAETEPPQKVVTARRSVTRKDQAVVSRTENSTYEYHAHDLSHRLLVPAVIEVMPHRKPDMIKHQGEEFIYVLEGRVEAQTEFYEPTILEVGDSIYIDSTMGHNLRALDGKPARVLNISSGRHRI
ncbi:MAG: XRE family transcriptional regulator [Xanthomonadales bacterium]|jgi:transcriptional regulator with XRE-family HTH domain|nr:XRE family transcriptional regulator [Xanthomonadales bacterium]